MIKIILGIVILICIAIGIYLIIKEPKEEYDNSEGCMP